MGSLIQRLNRAIDNEYDWKNQEVRETLKTPVEERVKKGDTIVDVYAEFKAMEFSNQPNDIGFFKVRVVCKDNKSKFRETTPVILSGHGRSFELDVLEDNDNEMLLGVGDGSGIIPRTLNNKDGWQIDTAAVDIRNIVKKSTSILSQNVGKLEYLNGIFEGEILPVISRDRKKMGDEWLQFTFG